MKAHKILLVCSIYLFGSYLSGSALSWATLADEMLCVDKTDSLIADKHRLIAKVIRHNSPQIPKTISVHEHSQVHNDSLSRDYLVTSQAVVDPQNWHWIERQQDQKVQLCVADPSISYKAVKKHD
jgi:hypothetical protein